MREGMDSIDSEAQPPDARARQFQAIYRGEFEFPRGALLDAREAARVDALCLQGRGAEAEAAARRLLAHRPMSPVTQRFDHFRCTR